MSEFIVETTEKTSNTTDCSNSLRSPKAVFFVSREEFYENPLELIVQQRQTETDCSPEELLCEQNWKEGKLPADLYGHVFIVGAVGYFGSLKYEGSAHVVEPVKNSQNSNIRNSLINGEGMIYRLDFHQTPNHSSPEIGKAWMATRIVKTPDHYADLALWQNGDQNEYRKKWPHEYPELEFYNFYISRASVKLGARNFLNTAFLPMKFSDGTERLLITWDVGRPYEIDPRTLGFCGPIGWNSQWHAMIPLLQDISHEIFPLTLSSAHPAFDTHTDEMFTVNASKSLRNFFWLSRLLTFDAREFADRYLKLPWLKNLFQSLVKGLIQFVTFLESLLEEFLHWFGIESANAVYLKRWQGKGTSVDEWKVLRENGRPVAIKQSLHQMGISKDYILLADSAFKLVLEDVLPTFSTKNFTIEDIEKSLRSIHEYLSYPQLPYTQIYIVPRAQLKPGVKTVKAKEVTIAPETAHFLVDYENPDGKIILHAAHTAATDPAEFLRLDDKSIYDEEVTKELRARAGMFLAPMDASRIGSWSIDVATQTCQPVFVSDAESCQNLWAISLYAWRGFQPQQFTDIYWNCWGGWQELLSDFMVEMYKEYKNRLVCVDEVIDTIKKGKPANLLRTHIERKDSAPTKLSIADIYNFPPGFLGNSPQFVPRQGTDDPTEGYIVCTVIYSDNCLANKCELWIFDAKNLKSGPCYRLSHPKLNIGVTIHTTWLSKLETPPARTDYNVRSDYQEPVQKTNSEAIKTLFEKDVYPHFKPQERKMITLISKWKLLDGCPPELVTALQKLAEHSKSEPGNLMYMVNLPVPNPLDAHGKPLSPPPSPIPLNDQKEVVFIESYQDVEALSQHLQSKSFINFLTSNIKYFCQNPQNPGYPQTETEFLSEQFS